jgi:hypothetical protein
VRHLFTSNIVLWPGFGRYWTGYWCRFWIFRRIYGYRYETPSYARRYPRQFKRAELWLKDNGINFLFHIRDDGTHTGSFIFRSERDRSVYVACAVAVALGVLAYRFRNREASAGAKALIARAMRGKGTFLMIQRTMFDNNGNVMSQYFQTQHIMTVWLEQNTHQQVEHFGGLSIQAIYFADINEAMMFKMAFCDDLNFIDVELDMLIVFLDRKLVSYNCK